MITKFDKFLNERNMINENFSKKQIENILSDAIKSGDIDMVKTNLDQFMNKFIDKSEEIKFGTFEYFVESEAKFISEGDWKRMEEYIQKFKEMNLDTTKVEKMLPKIKRYKYLQFGPLDNRGGFSKSELNKFEKESNELQRIFEPFKQEIRKLAKQAK